MSNVQVNSIPNGALVYIDYIDTLQLTPALLTLTEGNHTYLLRLPGYVDITGTIEVVAGNSYIVNAVMQSSIDVKQLQFNASLVKLGYVGLAVSIVAILLSTIPRKKG